MFSPKNNLIRLFVLLSLLIIALLVSACSRPSAETPGPAAEPISAEALALAGSWQGRINLPGAGLEIIVALAQQEGQWTGTIDVPAQGAAGIELHDIRVSADAVYFEMLSGLQKATFDGRVQPDGSISGAFKQMGVEGSFALARPLEPVAAELLPYAAEEVIFQNGDITLAGTLTRPQGDGPFPALILLSGSGQQDRDEALPTVPGYRPFREIADTLTRQGIAVLRYDDRGVGGSTGDPMTATSADFADDAETALAFLQSRADIDGQQIGFLGHSEGGILAAMVAARNPDVAFVISMAGTAVDGYQTVVKQVERLLLAAGASQAEADEAARLQSSVLDLVMLQAWDSLQGTLYDIALQQIAALPAEQRAALGDVNVLAQQQVAAQMQIFQSPWYQFFLSHNPGKDWAQVTAPVLGLYGGNDTQVDAEQNSAALQAALARAGNADVTIQVLPTANHLFQDAQTGGVDEYAMLSPQLVPEFLEAISQWLLARVQLP
jgi:uncharacterized protein